VTPTIVPAAKTAPMVHANIQLVFKILLQAKGDLSRILHQRGSKSRFITSSDFGYGAMIIGISLQRSFDQVVSAIACLQQLLPVSP
jgi:hypothetical protein